MSKSWLGNKETSDRASGRRTRPGAGEKKKRKRDLFLLLCYHVAALCYSRFGGSSLASSHREEQGRKKTSARSPTFLSLSPKGVFRLLIHSMADLPSSSASAGDDAVAARLAAAARVPLDRARFFLEAAGGDEAVALRMVQGAKEGTD